MESHERPSEDGFLVTCGLQGASWVLHICEAESL